MQNTSRLSGKVAIVTGSSQGIGQSIAERFAKEGASIVIDYRDHPEGANETQKIVEQDRHTGQQRRDRKAEGILGRDRAGI